jgi:hypothetical protein
MGFSDANQLLSGPRQPIAKFDSIGDTVTGTLVDAEVAPVTSPTGEVQYDKNGNPKQQIIYTLQTEERDPEIEDDDGKRRIFAKWAIQRAISTCLAEAGLAKVGLQEGGTLSIKFSGTQKASQRGYSDIKLYEATYVAPPARQLASPAGGEVAAPAAAAAAAPAEEYSQQQMDTAFSIYNANPDTPLEVISAATKIPVQELQGMFVF